MKKDATVFFCDICGTIDGKNELEDYEEFVKNLERIGQENGSDEVLFLFASTEDKSIKQEYAKKFNLFFNDYVNFPTIPEEIEIELESSGAKNQYFNRVLDRLCDEYNFKEIILADDSEFNHLSFSFAAEDFLTDDGKYTSIVTGEGNNNLKFINSELEEKFKKKII